MWKRIKGAEQVRLQLNEVTAPLKEEEKQAILIQTMHIDMMIVYRDVAISVISMTLRFLIIANVF